MLLYIIHAAMGVLFLVILNLIAHMCLFWLLEPNNRSGEHSTGTFFLADVTKMLFKMMQAELTD